MGGPASPAARTPRPSWPLHSARHSPHRARHAAQYPQDRSRASPGRQAHCTRHSPRVRHPRPSPPLRRSRFGTSPPSAALGREPGRPRHSPHRTRHAARHPQDGPPISSGCLQQRREQQQQQNICNEITLVLTYPSSKTKTETTENKIIDYTIHQLITTTTTNNVIKEQTSSITCINNISSKCYIISTTKTGYITSIPLN